MDIIVNNEGVLDEPTMELIRRAASACIESDVEISLSFVSLDEIHTLNREYRGVDRPTDVLSFPMYGSIEEVEKACGSMPGCVPLGDVVICMDKIKEQAKEYGHSEERETVYLFTHSVLHLLGYDHETEEDKLEMRAQEEAVMEKLGLGRSQTQTTDREETES